MTKVLLLVATVLTVGTYPVLAESISIPGKLSKKYLMAKAAEHNQKDVGGYLTLKSGIVIPLDGESYAFLSGIILGKRKGDSFHYFENDDLGFVCYGTGIPSVNGGTIDNECFLNGQSIGKSKTTVADYGKVKGKILFKVNDRGEEIGLASMGWGMSAPKPKSLLKFLKANGG